MFGKVKYLLATAAFVVIASLGAEAATSSVPVDVLASNWMENFPVPVWACMLVAAFLGLTLLRSQGEPQQSYLMQPEQD